MDAARIAIVGGGMIGSVHRRAALRAGARVVGVLDKDLQASQTLARAWGVQAFESVEQALAEGIDVLHICTPNWTHANYARQALEAAVNVVCEKPLCLDPDEAIELAKLARSQKLVAAVPYVYRFHPLVREIGDRLRAGYFGQLYLIHGTYLQDWLLSPLASGWRVDPRWGGGSRAFADVGSHWCDLIEWLTGDRITALVAEKSVAVSRRALASELTFAAARDGPANHQREWADVSTEDVMTVLFRTNSGVPGSLVVSQVSAGRKNHLWFEIDGAERSVVFDQENPESIWLGGEASSEIIMRGSSAMGKAAKRLNISPAGHTQGWEACFEAFISDVYAAVRGDQVEDLPTFDDGARSVHLIQAALDSAATHQWKQVRT